MNDEHTPSHSDEDSGSRSGGWQTPTFQVIPLDCEITAYAPDGDDPLF
jgi:hypothetical protein